MAITRATLQARVRQRADATSSERWSSTDGTGGEIDPIASAVFDREWRRLLSHQPYYRMALRQPTSSSTGRIALTDLDSGSGDSKQRFFRVLSFVRNNIPYRQVEYRDVVLGEALSVTSYTWWLEGSNLMFLPKVTSTAFTGTDGLWVAHLPQRPDGLSADTIDITFPDGYEEILVLETAAELLAKGGAETGATAELKALAERYRQDMLQDLSRVSTAPMRPQFDDFSVDWGG